MSKIGTREEYHEVIKQGMLGEENCPFCEATINRNEVIWEGKYWFIVNNKYPYIDNGQHIMLVPKKHRKFSTELTPEEWQEMSLAHEFVAEFFKNSLYFSFTRENFTRETIDGRSVEHWHMHFLPGILKGKYLREMLEKQGFNIPK